YGHDQSELLVEDAQASLTIQVELIGRRLRADQSGETNHPWAPLADPGRHPHLVRVRGLVLRDGRGGALMKVEGVLGQSSQVFQCDLAFLEKAREEFGVAAPVGDMREPKVSPGADAPVAVAVIDRVHWSAVRTSVVLM